MILWSIHPGDGRPIYRQIVEQAKGAIAAGRLRPGDQLPTHRELARELVIAPLTVKKAYDLLQSEGWIEMSQGRGTFVRQRSGSPAAGSAAREELGARLDALVRQARLMGLGSEETRKLLGKHWK